MNYKLMNEFINYSRQKLRDSTTDLIYDFTEEEIENFTNEEKEKLNEIKKEIGLKNE